MPRRDYSKVAFAATGDTATIPGTTQPDGSVSLPQGFGFDYERDNGAGGGTPDPLAKNIERQDMNGILNEITASVGEIQQNGLAIWVATAAPYPINAQVRHNDLNWQSLTINNSDTPGVGGGSTSWKNVSAETQGRFLATQKFTSGGTYTPTPGMRISRVRMVGAGGGSGIIPATSAGQYAAAGGGASGSWGEAVLTAIQIGASQAITIGAAGAAGTAGSAGGAGGATSVGSLLSCPGGGGSPIGTVVSASAAQQYAPGTPGAAPTGTFILASAGQQGEPGVSVLSATRAGTGGSTPFGCGGHAEGSAGAAQPGSGYGSGGSGAANAPSTAAKNGAPGAPGVVIIEEYT